MKRFTVSTLLIILLISAAIGALLWPYTINSWLAVAGKPPAVVWWQGALIGFVPFIGQATIPVALITWIAMLFLG